MIAGNHFCESMQLHAKYASGENLIIRSNDLYFSRALREEIHR